MCEREREEEDDEGLYGSISIIIVSRLINIIIYTMYLFI